MIDKGPRQVLASGRFDELRRETDQQRLFREIARQQKDRRALGIISALRSLLKSLFVPMPTAAA